MDEIVHISVVCLSNKRELKFAVMVIRVNGRVNTKLRTIGRRTRHDIGCICDHRKHSYFKFD